MKCLLAPYAAKLPNGARNAKNYPYWKEVVAQLNAEGHEVIQIGRSDETVVEGVKEFVANLPLDDLEPLVQSCDCWISVDSFLPHYCATRGLKSGIVIWSQSDYRIWGYPHNINLLRDPRFLRQYQYAPWYDAPYIEEAFVRPEMVLDAIHGRLTEFVTIDQVRDKVNLLKG